MRRQNDGEELETSTVEKETTTSRKDMKKGSLEL
jgi:hypothetical protein